MLVQYLVLTDASSGDCNLNLDKNSSYLTTFSCQYGRYRYARLQCGDTPAGGMFQKQIHKILKKMLKLFGIAGDILIVGHDNDGTEHDNTAEYSRYTEKRF